MTTVFFSGAESQADTELLIRSGVKHIIYSYFYLNGKGNERFVRKMQIEHPDIVWALDSGVHSYFQQLKAGKRGVPPIEAFVSRYFSFVNEYGGRYAFITEPDFDVNPETGVSSEQVRVWREEMMKTWPYFNICPVWNSYRGRMEWDEYVADPRIRHLATSYVCKLQDAFSIVGRARAAGKPVHGFGIAKVDMLDKVRFDSVSSSSWLAGRKYGTVFLWKGVKFGSLSNRKVGDLRRYSRYIGKIGCSLDKIAQGDSEEMTKCNVASWLYFSDKLVERARRRDELG